MSDLKKVLSRHLLLQKLLGSYILDKDGRTSYFQIARIVLCLLIYVYTTHHEFLRPIDFEIFVSLIRFMLAVVFMLVLILSSRKVKLMARSLEALERVSGCITVSKIKIVIWPSLVFNVLIMLRILSATVAKETLFNYAIDSQVFLLLNSFADEFSITVLFFCSISKSLNSRLAGCLIRKDLDSLLKAQDSLCSAVRHMNDFYSIHLLAMCAFSFYNTTMSIFFFIRDGESSILEQVRAILSILCFLQMYLKIILSVSTLTEQIHGFDLRLYEKFKSRPTSWMNLVYVEDLMADRNINISAAGFFDLTIENLGSMISAATTFLVILLQMN